MNRYSYLSGKTLSRYSLWQKFKPKPQYRRGLQVVPIIELFKRHEDRWMARDVGSDEPKEYWLSDGDLEFYYEPLSVY